MNIEALHKLFLKSSGVSTDTRQIYQNCIFFSLKGDNYNGNKFAQDALDKGALQVIIDEKKFHNPNGGTILVENVLTTLQQLARFHRRYLGLPIISLTGSNGKTTTKELLNSVLSQSFQTVATKGNLNNHIGVPLTLLKMNKETEIGIVEMGANHLGEIKILCEIAEPDYGYITNFGKAHLEGFGSLEGVIKGKTELYHFLKTQKGKLFINSEDPVQLHQSQELDPISFGSSNGDYRIELKDSIDNLILNFDNIEIRSNLIGDYNFTNISAAIAIGTYFGVSTKKIKAGIEAYIPSNNRSQLVRKDSNTILMDAYNANPSSMIAALKNFKKLEGQNKIIFLGDMFELGDDSHIEHQNIVDFLEEIDCGKVFLVGSNFYNTQHHSPHVHVFETFQDVEKELKDHTFTNATILIKASRGMALERILDLI